MREHRLVDVLLTEWLDAIFMTEIAFVHDTEGDSNGSMLTRAALVLLYAMVDAQLAIVSQWKMHENPSAFQEAEKLFLSEVAMGVGHDGEIWVDGDQHPFKKRIKRFRQSWRAALMGRISSSISGRAGPGLAKRPRTQKWGRTFLAR